MKISNSKKELARIISENGGWRDGTEWAAQDKLGPDAMADEVCFYLEKPERPSGADMWNARRPSSTVLRHFHSNGLISGWHQSCLSREEYFHLYPAPDADGWIEFDGTERPSGYFNRIIDAKLQDGRVMTDSSGRFEWDTDGPSRIIAYRLHKPGQAEDERCIQEAFVPEAKPSIEQLAADYRNRKDYADRKQEEADAAKDDAEAKLAELVAAGKENGLVLSVAEPEPDLVITDWRDLRFGDEIEYLEGSLDYMIGDVGAVCEFDEFHKQSPVRIESRRLKGTHQAWPSKWRFIRRP
ncbi:MAG: hypothetical protein ACRCXB_14605 [Aeromonadaceae bacterium]